MNSTCLLRTSLLLALLVSAACLSSAEEMRPLWRTDAATFTEAGPTVADINNDGACEVLAAGREELVALDASGKILWRTKGHVRFMTVPTVLARPGQPALIYAADNGGFMICVDGTGKVVWDVKLKGAATWTTTAVSELNGAPVLVQGDESGTVAYIDALTGKVLAEGKVTGMPSSPAMADIDGDEKPEAVVITTLGKVSAVNAAGAILWETPIGGTAQTWGNAAPVIFGASSGAVRIFAASNDNLAVCLGPDGREVWRHAVRGAVAATLSAGDFDGDGRADLFLITQVGVIYRFDEDGALLWEIDMQGRTLAAGALADIDGNGRLEYVFCTQDGHLQALNQAGVFVMDYQFPHRTINVTPAFGDIDPKTPGLEMAITGGEAGLIYVFPTKAPKTPASPWYAYRGNDAKNGAWFGLTQSSALRMTAAHLSADKLYANEPVRFQIAVPSPGEAPLKATAWCVRPDGSRQSAASKVVGAEGVLELPLAATLPGAYAFGWTLQDAQDKVLLEGQKMVSAQPFACDRALVAGALETLARTAASVEKVLPRPARALRDEAKALSEQAEVARAAQDASVSGAQAEARAIEETGAANARARHALAAAKVLESASILGTGTSLAAFEMPLWENRGIETQVPSVAVNPVGIRRRLVKDEHESVSIGLFNILDTPQQVRVSYSGKEGEPKVTLLHSVEVPTSQGGRVWDALPQVEESGVVTIPPLTTVEVWADISTQGVAPGAHTVKIVAQSLTGAGVLDGPSSPQSLVPKETAIEISMNILPFEMAASGSVRLCAWANYTEGAVGDLLEHGNNVFLAPNGTPKFDAAGGLERVDFAALDARIEPLRGHDVVVLLNGMPAIPGELGSPEYAKKFTPFVQATVQHMTEKGFDTDHFAFYPIDEPGGYGWGPIKQMVAFGQLLRAANPKAMLYVDGGGELDMFKAMAPTMDIWTPGISMLAEKTPTMDVVRNSGRMLWSYDCAYAYARPGGPNIKNINIPGQFLTAPLFVFRHNATGLGYWSYNIGESLWGRTQFEYPLVYEGRTKPVSSRRWEAVREGLEDFRIAAALRERAKDEKLDAAVRERIRKLLEERIPAVIDKSATEARLGLARYVLDAGLNDAVYAGLRAEMLDCAEAVAR